MKVGFRVASVNTRAATAKAAAARKRAVTLATEAARMDTRPYVPWREGHLARTADTASKPERGLLIYGNGHSVAYARAQYYGLPNKSTIVHAKATAQWFEASKAANKTRWQRIMSREYGRTFGGG